ncbi:MAG: GNAT family protein [Eubacteriales bacterium]|nr:GNAT family protein [Eubacteriales bacterium]
MLLPQMKDLPLIEGEKVVLRPITDADTDDIVRWRNDPEVWRYFLFREPFTPEMHRAWLRDKVAAGRVVQYIITERESGRSVGSVYFRDVDRKNESAEYGIFIGEADARGRGIGTETARLFTDFGLNVLRLHRISLKVLGDNEIARRSYEKAGFRTEGVFRDYVKLDGVFTDVVFMAKLGEG